MSKPISHFLGEGLLIVFSILLALGANEWRTHSNDARNLKRAVADLSAEISENLILMEGLPEYHRMIGIGLSQSVEELRKNPEEHSKTPIQLMMKLDGLRNTLLGFSAPLQSVSWQTAKDRGIVAQLDYDTAKALSATYDEQLADISTMMYQIGGGLGDIKMHKAQDQEAILTALSANFFEFAAREESLIYLLEKSQKILHEQYPKAAATDQQGES